MTRRSVSSLRARHRHLPVAGLVVLLGTFSAFAEEDLGQSIAARVKELFTFNRNAVVKIQSSDQHGQIEGTGFYADSSGTIYTVVEVLGDAKNITVCQGMRKMPASLLIADPRTGIALIKVAGAPTPFIPIGDSSKLEISSPLIAIGYPTDHNVSPSFGLVAGFDKEYLNKFFRTTHIRANLPVQPGLGGAPALNLSGEVVGIVVAGVDGNASCYVLPINAAEKTRMDYANFGKLKPGYVGISVESAPDGSQPSTARVANLQPDSPAAQAGIREGDLLLKVGEVPVHNPVDIFDASFFLTAGAETPVTVWRNGKEEQLNVRVAASPYNSEPTPSLTTLTLETSVAPTP
jgi:serine protease Do